MALFRILRISLRLMAAAQFVFRLVPFTTCDSSGAVRISVRSRH